MIRQRIVLASAAGLASALLLAACGSSTGNASSTSSGNAATAAADPATSAPATSTPADSGSGDMATTTMLMAKAMTGMGSVVTDDKGMTLYRYDMDQATPSMSMCTGACAKTWMPIMAQDSVQTMGVEKSLLGSVARSDGMKQLTLGGWPLYRYMGDTKAGQMNGQGKDKMWFAVTPSGKKSA